MRSNAVIRAEEELIIVLRKDQRAILDMAYEAGIAESLCDKFKDQYKFEEVYSIPLAKWHKGKFVEVSPPKCLSLNGVTIKIKSKRFYDLIPLFEAFEEAGLEVRKSEDYASIERRSFYLGKYVIISVFPDGADSACHKVATGETEPVYKLVCN